MRCDASLRTIVSDEVNKKFASFARLRVTPGSCSSREAAAGSSPASARQVFSGAVGESESERPECLRTVSRECYACFYPACVPNGKGEL